MQKDRVSKLSEKEKNKLLKKHRCNLTKYTNLVNNWFIKIIKKWNLTIEKDCSMNKDFYLERIEISKRVIEKFNKS